MLSAILLLALWGYAAGSDVIEFTVSDFDESIKEHDLILVEFFAPWCGHCKKLAPEYEKAATDLAKSEPSIPLAKINCEDQSVLCTKFEVRGYPTLKVFRKGQMVSDYDGPRDAEGIVKYMRSLHGPSSKELRDLKEFEAFIDSKEMSVIGLFEKDSKLKDSFLKVADIERTKYRFAHTLNSEVLKKYKLTDDIVVFWPKSYHTKFEEPMVRYDGNFDSDRIKKFLQSEIHGLCGHRTGDNAEGFKNPLIVAYYEVDFDRNPKSTNYIRNRIMKVAKDYKRRVSFAVSNRGDMYSELSSLGLYEQSEKRRPFIVAFDEENRKYIMEKDFGVDALREFVEDFLANKLEAFIKSEPVPEKNDGPVTVVVGKTFEEIVNQDKDVMIEFYAPWCGHCKNLAPIYEEVGTKMKGEEMIIAKMDATANEVPPPYVVEGFPTIYFSKRDNKSNPKKYSGSRDVDGFIKFLAKEASSELKGWDRSGKPKKQEL